MLKLTVAIALILVLAGLAGARCMHIHLDGARFTDGLFLAANLMGIVGLVRALARGPATWADVLLPSPFPSGHRETGGGTP